MFGRARIRLALSVALSAAVPLSSCGLLQPDETLHIGGPPCPEANPWVVDSYEMWGPSDGVIELDRDVIVTSSGILRILRGTEIEFIDNTVCVDDPAGNVWVEPTIRVEGRLLCEGTPDSVIRFTAEDDWWMRRNIRILADESRPEDSVIRWSDVGFVEWSGGNPTISHSQVAHLHLHACGGVQISDCTIGGALVLDGAGGMFSGNTFTSRLSVYGDSLQISGNVFRDVPSEYWGAIRFNTSSRSQVVSNLFEGCDIAVGIYSGTPELHFNNFIDNGFNMSVIAEPEPVETDTIDARDNWWGTTDAFEVLELIHYEERDGYYSGKTVLSSPFALEPFDLTEVNGLGAERPAP